MNVDSFFRVYSKMPEAERKSTIAIIDNKEITWEMAFKEITNKTQLGTKILEKLNKLGII